MAGTGVTDAGDGAACCCKVTAAAGAGCVLSSKVGAGVGTGTLAAGVLVAGAVVELVVATCCATVAGVGVSAGLP